MAPKEAMTPATPTLVVYQTGDSVLHDLALDLERPADARPTARRYARGRTIREERR